MAEDTETVKADIDRTRKDLGQTLDAIGDKVSPKQAVRRRTDRAREAFTNVRERVMGSASDVGSSVSDQASAVGSSVAQTASNIVSTAGDAVSSAADSIRGAPDMARRQAQGNPLAVGLIAFGAGALVAALIPPTTTERNVAPALRDSVVEPLKEEAKQAGQDLKNELEPEVRGAVEQVKGTAQEAADEVRQEAQNKVQDVKGQAQESAATIKEQAQESARTVHDEPPKG